MQLHYRMNEDATRTEALRSLRSTLEWLGDDVHYISNEVDPIVEMCTITKAFDNSKALVANKIKGYPGVRMISNLYSTKARTAKLHGDGRLPRHQAQDSGLHPQSDRAQDRVAG